MRDGAKDGSIPACTSYECKLDTATNGWDVPTEFTYGQGPDFIYRLNQRQSVPACTSLGCSKGSVLDGTNAPSLNPDLRHGGDLEIKDGKIWTYGAALPQKASIPACDSTGCKSASASSGWNVPTMSPEVYGNNGEYTYATNDHK
jgi:hypothetical protein